ncbi:hypothetical protein CWI42_091260 [Ordospora colligata]|uniref:Uncharacterized protein n=1 Tax=Ordospora colligata OC4 TaxID=1354746 RepID=A0A0B2UJP5_9MICR|nr:uncharacterized protein M896_091280 [Ordospora colligata OC4]KHN69200.1 hypothetical protein M896_091280 [Ordospora colligata OC4]TBU14478.1 hypothetical protein CWI40_091240 [Ordospora colligata]TBU14655.1 hypothetical protein CWI41_091270 [Ordospora colligata]TBU18040.1 hypothetical protein CWI42_091260 [Ordospora colligata]
MGVIEAKEWVPVEVTTHNLYFHEEASVFTMDTNGKLIATGGGDNEIRLWRVEKSNMDGTEFRYTTALNSSVKIVYDSVLSGHKRGVNCVRFNGDLLASCSDGGEVIIWVSKVPHMIKRIDGDDAYEAVWGRDHLFVGFSSGHVLVYKVRHYGMHKDVNASMNDSNVINAVEECIDVQMIQKIQCHNDVVQGLAFNNCFGLLTSLGKDRIGKTYVFRDKLVEVEHMDEMNGEKMFSTGRGFFRRLSYSPDGKLLYLASCSSNSVIVLHYPFRIEHVYARIGPLDSEPLRIVCDGDKLYVATRKRLYMFVKQELVLCVDNISFMAITDGCVFDGICFLSSLDGFLCSLRVRQ